MHAHPHPRPTHTPREQQPAWICENAQYQADSACFVAWRFINMEKTANVICVDFIKAFGSVLLWQIHDLGYPMAFLLATEAQSRSNSRTD